MGRPLRCDEAGAWYHVMNRGLARRTLFEHLQDIGRFLNELGEASDREEIEVHAYCVMTTHYHLLVRSRGHLSAAMQRVQTAYSRWFNRGRDRDGALVKGRFVARPIDSTCYAHAVVAYIDRNPVAAGIVDRVDAYPYGSARAYGVDPLLGPAWLRRDWIESEVCRVRDLERYDRRAYARVFGQIPEALAAVVEARCRSASKASDFDPLDDLVQAAPRRITEWMLHRARLADGTRPGLPVLTWDLVADAALRLARGRPSWTVHRRYDAWRIIRLAVARQLTGESLSSVARREGVSTSAVVRALVLHRLSMLDDPDYAEAVGCVVHDALGAWRNLGRTRRSRVASHGSGTSVPRKRA